MIEGKVDEVRRAMYGYNGETGLLGRVDKLEEMSRAIMRLAVGIGTGVGIAIILGLLALIRV